MPGKQAGTEVDLNGGVGNDRLTGGSGNDQLLGQAGNDTLLGLGGVDLLFGQGGSDRMVWNPGDDRAGEDVIIDDLGVDEVQWADRVGSSWVQTHARVRDGKTVLVLDGKQRELPRAELHQLKWAGGRRHPA